MGIGNKGGEVQGGEVKDRRESDGCVEGWIVKSICSGSEEGVAQGSSSV